MQLIVANGEYHRAASGHFQRLRAAAKLAIGEATGDIWRHQGDSGMLLILENNIRDTSMHWMQILFFLPDVKLVCWKVFGREYKLISFLKVCS